MIAVPIELTADNYQSGAYDTSSIKGEIAVWLEANIRNYWSWERETRRLPSKVMPGGTSFRPFLVFRFEDPAEATLFKLTWA